MEDLKLITAVSVFATWVAKKTLDKTWVKIFEWFRKDSPRGILIIGPGGVGKSTLAHLLASTKYDKGNTKGEYVESISTECFKLSDDSRVQIIVPPGQTHRKEATWATVLSDVKLGKFRGVVFVVAYGNHTIGDFSIKNHRLFDAETGVEAFVPKYTSSCLKVEEDVLQTVCEAISLCDKPLWLMTLVTKQDLWWDEKDAVEKYYLEGKYGLITNECVGRKTEKLFRHESAFVSLAIRNLTTGQNELLKKTVAGYDSLLQEKSFDRFVQVLDGLMEWESQHGE